MQQGKSDLAPTLDGAVATQRASVSAASTDGGEASRWSVGLAKLVVTPTLYGIVVAQGTGIGYVGGDSGEASR